jgi:DNA polymerase III epsilon subunit-like protein
MSNFLFFDTETTGLPANYSLPASYTYNWPRAVSLSWALFDSQRKLISQNDHIIKPDGWHIPAAATAIHGISQEQAEREGVPIGYALATFLEDLYYCEFLVAHNMDFDLKIVEAEFIRVMGIWPGKNPERKICTMKMSTQFCKLPQKSGRGAGYKWPKLEELHKALFSQGFEGAHNSLVDVLACARCFFALVDRGIIVLEGGPNVA